MLVILAAMLLDPSGSWRPTTRRRTMPRPSRGIGWPSHQAGRDVPSRRSRQGVQIQVRWQGVRQQCPGQTEEGGYKIDSSKSPKTIDFDIKERERQGQEQVASQARRRQADDRRGNGGRDGTSQVDRTRSG